MDGAFSLWRVFSRKTARARPISTSLVEVSLFRAAGRAHARPCGAADFISKTDRQYLAGYESADPKSLL